MISLSADQTDLGIINTQEYPELQMTELTLSNGMRIILKQTDDDSEITVRLSALGGYADLPHDDRASGELAANFVMESGLGELSADKLSAFLYDHSIEFNLKVEAYTRGIDASLPEDSLEALFCLVNKTFTSPNFSPDSFKGILAKKKNEIIRKGENSSIDDILGLVSLQERNALRPLKIRDVEKADLNKATEFFLASFSNPKDFICVIAGDIDIDKTKRLASQYLSSLPLKDSNNKLVLPCYHRPPKVIAKRTQSLPNSNESLVRLAFPLQIKLDSNKLEQLELICQIVENRLRNIVKSRSYDAKGVDVWYELPLYPSLEHPWMTIQFHVENTHIKPTIDLVVDELKRVCHKGFSPEEVKLAAKMKKQSLQLWEHDNDYWIVVLSNHYLWGWNPQRIIEKFKNPATSDPKDLHATIGSALLIDEYTFSK